MNFIKIWKLTKFILLLFKKLKIILGGNNINIRN